MRRTRKIKILILSTLCVCILLMSVGFALMATTLNILGTARMNPADWYIYFDNLSEVKLKGGAQVNSNPTITNGTTLGNYDVDVTRPGDSITYTFDIVNDGDDDAYLSSLVKNNNPTCSGGSDSDNEYVCNNLTYTLKYTDTNTEVALNDKLDEHTKRNVTLKLEYNRSVTTPITSIVSISGLNITLVYTQVESDVNPEVPVVNKTVTLVDGDNSDTRTISSNSVKFEDLSITGKSNISCNNGAIPTYKDNTLKVSNVTGNTTCTTYSTLQSAISNLDTSTGIVMIANETPTYSITIPSGKTVTLDINGKSIEATYDKATNMITNIGTLTINDSVGTGLLKSNYTVIISYRSSNTTINSGSFESINANTIRNYDSATVVINNGNFTRTGSGDVIASINNANLTINNGNFTSASQSTILAQNNNANVTINNGTFYNSDGQSIYTGGSSTMTINGGTFYTGGTLSTIAHSSTGNLTINGITAYKTAESTSGAVISNNSSGNIYINDTKDKVYIANLSTAYTNIYSPKTVYNASSGNIYIRGKVADTCNSTLNSNKKGICIYGTTRTILNETSATGIIDINGAHIVSSNFIGINAYSGNVYVKESKIIGNNAIVNSAGNGNIYLCNNYIAMGYGLGPNFICR